MVTMAAVKVIVMAFVVLSQVATLGFIAWVMRHRGGLYGSSDLLSLIGMGAFLAVCDWCMYRRS